MAKSSKPCPQCGQAMHRPFKGDGSAAPFPIICNRCSGYIEKGREAEKRETERAGFDAFNLPQGDSWPLRSPASDEIVRAHVSALRIVLAEAFSQVAEPALTQDGYGGDVFHYLPFHENHQKWRRVLLSTAGADKIRLLHEILEKAIQEIYKAGVKEGQNLLKQLATQQISHEEFDSVERPKPPAARRSRR